MHACVVTVAAALGLAVSAPAVSETPALEYQVKASMIYNFMQFVEWPASEGSGDFVICVIGEDRFGKALDAIEGDSIRERKLSIQRMGSDEVNAESRCAVAFVSASEAERVEEIVGELKGRSTLTIGETDGFVQSGGIVNLKVVDGRLRFDINRRSARLARLRISSKLLRLADEVIE